MVRRTINMPESTDSRVRELAADGESFSAAVTRLLEEGMRAIKEGKAPAFVGSGESDGPDDLGLNAEKYLRELFAEADPND